MGMTLSAPLAGSDKDKTKGLCHGIHDTALCLSYELSA